MWVVCVDVINLHVCDKAVNPLHPHCDVMYTTRPDLSADSLHNPSRCVLAQSKSWLISSKRQPSVKEQRERCRAKGGGIPVNLSLSGARPLPAAIPIRKRLASSPGHGAKGPELTAEKHEEEEEPVKVV